MAFFYKMVGFVPTDAYDSDEMVNSDKDSDQLNSAVAWSQKPRLITGIAER